ncbi:MAG TPA: ABC transporter permease [Acidimicrobiia bacterium]|nr:ABC transporter permease [Acidimicrobiia bacterium]
MSALTKMTTIEAKLFAREPMAVFWGLAFPSLLLLLLGFAFPGGRVPSEDLGGFRLVDLYAPIVLFLALATVAFATLPPLLAGYREMGLLRRLSTTPVGSRRLVGAQLLLQVSVAFLAGLLALAVAGLVFEIPMPGNIVGFVFSFFLAALSMLSVGLFIGAVAPSASSGQGIGMAVYFPMLFFAGVYFPRDVMPEGMRRVSDFTPAGATVQALQDTWMGLAAPGSSLLVMAAFALGFGLLAALFFRWE